MESIQKLTLKTCARCGIEFRAAGQRWACDDCLPQKRPSRKVLLGDPLTSREGHVTELVAQCLPNKIIAWQLHLSEGTVKEYLSVIYKKLGVKNRTELALWYVKQQQAAA